MRLSQISSSWLAKTRKFWPTSEIRLVTNCTLSHNFPVLDMANCFSVPHVYESLFAFFEAKNAFVERVFCENLEKLVNRQPLEMCFWGKKRFLFRFRLENEHVCHKNTTFGVKQPLRHGETFFWAGRPWSTISLFWDQKSHSGHPHVLVT